MSLPKILYTDKIYWVHAVICKRNTFTNLISIQGCQPSPFLEMCKIEKIVLGNNILFRNIGSKALPLKEWMFQKHTVLSVHSRNIYLLSILKVVKFNQKH